jgi:hypothetical protein
VIAPLPLEVNAAKAKSAIIPVVSIICAYCTSRAVGAPRPRAQRSYSVAWHVYTYSGCVLQSPSFKGELGTAQDLRRRTKMTPVKGSHTRIKPLALASGYSRYITVAPKRTLLSVGGWPLHVSGLDQVSTPLGT